MHSHDEHIQPESLSEQMEHIQSQPTEAETLRPSSDPGFAPCLC